MCQSWCRELYILWLLSIGTPAFTVELENAKYKAISINTCWTENSIKKEFLLSIIFYFTKWE